MTAREPARPPGFARSAAAVMRHEVRLAFHSPMSYVLALGFVLAVSTAVFAVGEFLDTNEASVRLFTLFLPWAAVVFVPALAMRAWSAGHDDRALEFAMSLPLGDGALVAGKFLAGLAVLAFVLLLATVFPATVFYLGEPDPGAMAGAWLAAFALLAAFHAVALGAAAMTEDATAAFVAGACALFALVMAGTDGVAHHLDDWLPARGVEAVTSLGPRRWMEELASGRLGVGALAYFGLMPILALAGHPRPRRRTQDRGPGPRGGAARGRRVRRARRVRGCGHRCRGAPGRFRGHQRGARAHPGAGDSHDPPRAAGRGRRDALLERGAARHPRRHPHPTRAAPGRCSTSSRGRAAESSWCAGAIRGPIPRPRSPPSGRACAGSR